MNKPVQFLALDVNMSKTVRDTSKVSINDYHAVAYVLSIGTKIDGLR